jgi:hypothetical protein
MENPRHRPQQEVVGYAGDRGVRHAEDEVVHWCSVVIDERSYTPYGVFPVLGGVEEFRLKA